MAPSPREMPVSTYALIQLAAEGEAHALRAIRSLPVVLSAEAVRGPYDVIAELSAAETGPLWDVPGVERVVACFGVAGGEPALDAA